MFFLYLNPTNGICLITAFIRVDSDVWHVTLYVRNLLEESTELNGVFILLLNKWIVCRDNISFHPVSKFMCLMSPGLTGY